MKTEKRPIKFIMITNEVKAAVFLDSPVDADPIVGTDAGYVFLDSEGTPGVISQSDLETFCPVEGKYYLPGGKAFYKVT